MLSVLWYGVESVNDRGECVEGSFAESNFSAQGFILQAFFPHDLYGGVAVLLFLNK